MEKPAVTITVSGLPASGKSTIISRIAKMLLEGGWDVTSCLENSMDFKSYRANLPHSILLVEKQTQPKTNLQQIEAALSNKP